MRRPRRSPSWTAAFLVALFPAFSGCHSRDRVHVETDEGPPRLAMMINLADEKTSPQLLEGFYGLEDGTWRWTAARFSVLLSPPPGSAKNGALLKVRLTIPQPLIDHEKTVALTASIQGDKLSPESFTQAGEFNFIREVPPSLLDHDSVTVDFSLDRFLAAGTVDGRELGLIVTAVGFEPQKSLPILP